MSAGPEALPADIETLQAALVARKAAIPVITSIVPRYFMCRYLSFFSFWFTEVQQDQSSDHHAGTDY